MRWEITVTTHLFVTCRTGFHSAAGEVASRPGRGGRARAGTGEWVPARGTQHPAAPPAGPPPPRPPTRSASVGQPKLGVSEIRGGAGATLCAPALARSAGDEMKLARRDPAGFCGSRAPGEARSRGAGAGGPPSLVEPGLGPGGPDPEGPAEQFVVQPRSICWALAPCGKAREAPGARRPVGGPAGTTRPQYKAES